MCEVIGSHVRSCLRTPIDSMLWFTQNHLYPHISILQAGADSKLGITYNNSVYIVKINNDPACDSLPSLDHAQQC